MPNLIIERNTSGSAPASTEPHGPEADPVARRRTISATGLWAIAAAFVVAVALAVTVAGTFASSGEQAVADTVTTSSTADCELPTQLIHAEGVPAAALCTPAPGSDLPTRQVR
jgi:hypothetical protein